MAEELCHWINERVDSKNQRVHGVTILEDFPRVTARENSQEHPPRTLVDRARKNLESMPFADTTSRETGCLQFGSIVPSVFTPVLAKHSKSFSLIDSISVGVDRMQRNFEPMRKQAETCQRSELTDVTAKVVIYEAFVEGKLRLPSTWRGLFTCASSRTMTNSSHGRSGVSRMRLLRHSRNWIRFLSSRRPPNSVNSSKPGFHSRSSHWGGVGQRRSSSMNGRALRGGSTYPSIGMGISGSG